MQTEYVTFIADFKIEDRLAYLSHQETLTLWRRVLVRGQVPLVYSQGFNPHPHIALPLPRSVGVQSDCERLCARVAAAGFCARAAGEAIRPLLPDGCRLYAVEALPGKAAFYPMSVTYRFTLAAAPARHRQNHFDTCKLQTLAHEPVVFSRSAKNNRQQRVDIRPFLEELSHTGRVVQMRCAVRPEGTVRVDELMSWLGLERDDLAEPVRRCAVRWVSETKFWKGQNTLS